MSEEKVSFHMNEPINITMALDLIIYTMGSFIGFMGVTKEQQEKRMEMVNTILDSWEKRLINQQIQTNKINSHALAEMHQDMTSDVADILMDVHSIETNTARKEFKRFIRHLMKEMIEQSNK